MRCAASSSPFLRKRRASRRAVRSPKTLSYPFGAQQLTHTDATTATLAVVDADAAEIRVLGSLIEKQRTTPDVYPLSLNALRLACNQSTNRDPVVEYDEPTIRAALERLSRKQWVRLASGRGSRAVKYRHLLDDALGLSGAELSLLAVLMLRGPQTLGELKQRTERMYRFEPAELEETLAALSARELVARQTRRPGQKEERYAQLLETDEGAPTEFAPIRTAPTGDLEDRVSRLEADVAALREELETLRARG
jgi:uncharacterized protein YceH (UPF0502 family)